MMNLGFSIKPIYIPLLQLVKWSIVIKTRFFVSDFVYYEFVDTKINLYLLKEPALLLSILLCCSMLLR